MDNVAFLVDDVTADFPATVQFLCKELDMPIGLVAEGPLQNFFRGLGCSQSSLAHLRRPRQFFHRPHEILHLAFLPPL